MYVFRDLCVNGVFSILYIAYQVYRFSFFDELAVKKCHDQHFFDTTLSHFISISSNRCIVRVKCMSNIGLQFATQTPRFVTKRLSILKSSKWLMEWSGVGRFAHKPIQ